MSRTLRAALLLAPQLSEPSGVLEPAVGARILERAKDPSGGTTHFLVETREGREGWFAWHGNEITGWTGNSC